MSKTVLFQILQFSIQNSSISNNSVLHKLGGSYAFAEMKSVYSTNLAEWAPVGGVLPLCKDGVSVFYRPSLAD